MLFHHRQAQSSIIRDLLITAPITDEPCHLLFATGEPGQVRQARAAQLGLNLSPVQIFALDKEVGSGNSSRAELLKAEGSAQVPPAWMMNYILATGG